MDRLRDIDLEAWNDHYDGIENAAFVTLDLLAIGLEQIPELESVEQLSKVMKDLERVFDEWWEYYESVEDFTTFEAVALVLESIRTALILAESRIEELQKS